MTASNSKLAEFCVEHGNVIAALSDELHVPAEEVGTVFLDELHRLAARARVKTYVVLLATRNTRSILRNSHKGAHP